MLLVDSVLLRVPVLLADPMLLGDPVLLEDPVLLWDPLSLVDLVLLADPFLLGDPVLLGDPGLLWLLMSWELFMNSVWKVFFLQVICVLYIKIMVKIKQTRRHILNLNLLSKAMSSSCFVSGVAFSLWTAIKKNK